MMDQEKPSLFEKFDNQLMKGTNAGVRAWNWTTGRTKADLANLTQTVGTASTLVGGFIQDTEHGIGFSLVLVPASLIKFWLNHYQTNLETQSEYKNAKDLKVEKIKSIHLKHQYAHFVTSGLMLPLGYSDASVVEGVKEFTCAGFLTMGLSHQIMRADYLPPRKNCVSRGLDKLTEKLKEIEIPNPIPQPSPVPTNYQVI